ncbi:MAG: HEAT repeat domain-containing protein [Spirochaetota bacterium]|nr:HEAT repeat domain-containing protein [Spirochaetota bacterium]
MKKFKSLITLSVIILTALISLNAQSKSKDNKLTKIVLKTIQKTLILEPVKYANNKEKAILCVIPTKDDKDVPGSIWIILNQNSYYQKVIGNSITSMSIVNQVKVSSNSKYLAVTSVGEGNLILEIFDLQMLLNNKKVKTIIEINPHPGYIGIIEWSKDKLIIESDILLTHTSNGKFKHYDNRLTLEKHELFYLDIRTKKITPKNQILKTPVKYYSNLLNRKNHTTRLKAIEALKILKSHLAVPYLQKALKNEKNLRVKEELKNAIKSLKK